MTKKLITVCKIVQDRILDGPWPPERILIDAWAALDTWTQSGQHIYRVRDGERPPALAADTVLASAYLRREGQCYILDRDKWIILGRIAAQKPVHVSKEKVLAFRKPLLIYCSETKSGGLASGHFSLDDQPTPRQLQLLPGKAINELWERKLEADEISDEGLLIVQALPFFYRPSTKQT